MDVDEDMASGAASARKRQRRSADSGDHGAGEAEAQQIGDEKPVSAEDSVIDGGGNNNNNYEEGDMMRTEQATATASKDNQQQTEAVPEEEVAGPSYQMGHLSSEAAVAVLANNKRSRTRSATTTNDSDDDDGVEGGTEQQRPEAPIGSATVTAPVFNQRNIPRTRSYRINRINVELLATITDSSSSGDSDSDPDDPAEAAPLLETADAESGTEEAAEAVANADDADSNSSSSSSNSDAIWRRYDFSSDSDSTIEIDDGDELHDAEPNAADRETINTAVTEVMCKCKPAYSWCSAQELMQREHNIINRIGWRGGHTSTQSFAQGYYGSRLVVEQMSLLHEMSKHSGCVNCLNFNRSGDLVCSGSDDLNIIVWDWAKNEPLHKFRSGHSMNIFQSKFIDSAGCLDIVSASRDGQVRRAVVPPSGGVTEPTRLYSHTDAVHKIVVVPLSRHEVMSAGEDGAIKHFDLRTSTEATTMLRCVHSSRNERGGRQRGRVRLFSIAHHPFAPEFCVSGSDDNLRVYDKRKLTKPVHEMTPRQIKETKITQITCAVYNHSGSEILASYSDAGIYLYDSRNYTDGETLHCYEGHINSRTIKGVNFFGPRSEYVVSGSDCGNIFFWEKSSAAIVNFMKGDHAGVVNCLEPHPWMPVLATSGLEHKVKIWMPKGPGSVPDGDTLKQQLQRNFRRNVLDTNYDINQFQYFIRQFLESSPRRRSRIVPHSEHDQAQQDDAGNQQEDNSNSSTSDSSPSQHPASQRQRHRSNSESSDDTNGDVEAAAAADGLDSLSCRTQ